MASTAAETTETSAAAAAATNLSFKITLAAFLKLKKIRARREAKEQAKAQAAAEEAEQRVLERENSIYEALEFIEAFVDERWSSHRDMMRIKCPHTMPELMEIGTLAQSEGVRACYKLVSIPVLFDEIALALWRRLAEMKRGPGYVEEDLRRAEEANQKNMADFFPRELDQVLGINRPSSVAGQGKEKRGKKKEEEKGRSRDASPKGKEQEKATEDPASESSQSKSPKTPKLAKFPKLPKSSKSPKSRKPHRQCSFCRAGDVHNHGSLPSSIFEAPLNATRGRVMSKNSSAGEGPSSAAKFATLRRSNSISVDSLIWYRENMSETSLLPPRARSFSHRLSTVAELGKKSAMAIGEGLAHGYGGYGGSGRPRPDFCPG